MQTQELFNQIIDNIDLVVKKEPETGYLLWQQLIQLHPADIAQFLSDIKREEAKQLFLVLPKRLAFEVFTYSPISVQVFFLSFLPDHERSSILYQLPTDELTDLFDDLSDDELKKYIKLLNHANREKVISLMQFDPESAGGIMNTDVLTFMVDFTIEKSIKLLQRLQPDRELHPHIYITDHHQHLLGHIDLQDLVFRNPQTRLSSIMQKNDLVVNVNEDREKIAQDMTKYKVMTVPVVDEKNIILGIIPSSTLVDIIEDEAAEDVYKISALRPIKNTYFDTPFFQLFYQRSSILIVLLLLQTFSSIIQQHFESLLAGFLTLFITMIASTGGNTSSQTSALVIQGMISGEITDNNIVRFLKREFLMALAIGSSLGVISFLRISITNPGHAYENFTVSLTLAMIVLTSVMLGSFIPFLLKKLKLDPALSAGPFLATLMDILGILIYCTIGNLIIRR